MDKAAANRYATCSLFGLDVDRFCLLLCVLLLAVSFVVALVIVHFIVLWALVFAFRRPLRLRHISLRFPRFVFQKIHLQKLRLHVDGVKTRVLNVCDCRIVATSHRKLLAL